MSEHRDSIPPMLYTGVDGQPTLLGIQELMQGNIDEQRMAVHALRMFSHMLEQYDRLDNDPQWHFDTRHHLYGGCDNKQIIGQCALAEIFYDLPENSMFEVRRDIHTRIEQLFGWFPLPDRETMREVVENTEAHLSASKTKKLDKCDFNCDDCPLRRRDG